MALGFRWRVVPRQDARFLGYFRYEEEPSRRPNMTRLTREEARRITTNIVALLVLRTIIAPAPVSTQMVSN